MADKKISELDLALLIDNDAEFPISQDNAGEPTTFKGRITQLGTKIAEDMTFSNLQTANKKLVGAINELLALGSPIIIGTSAPTSSQGANGNLYIQYTAGTGGADDTVDGIYVKIDGAWCEISTGGGSGTTDYEDLSNKPQVNSVELVGNKSLDDLGIMPASLSKTVSGSIAHFTDGADNIPVKSLVSQIVAVESGSGAKSPTNPYTISGFDSGVITRCGKNLVSDKIARSTILTDGSIASPDNNHDMFLAEIKQGVTYTIKSDENTSPSRQFVGAFFTSKPTIGSVSYSGTRLDDVSATFTAPITGWVAFRASHDYAYAQCERGNEQTTYEAYNGNDYTFTFGQTVYGGNFDNKGNLVVTHKIVDFGDVGYYYSNNRFSSTDIPDVKNVSVWNSALTLCSCYDITEVQTWTQGDSIIGMYGKNIYVKDSRYTDTASFKQALTGQKFVVELANPITLAITSQDIPTLLGENNIFSNCGDVEVNYYTDNADEIVEVAKATASTPLHNYSENEQVVGTWIDGSTLYEKTVYNAGGTYGEINIQHGVSNLGRIVYAEGVCSDSDATPYNYYPFSRISGDGNNIGISVTTASIVGVYIPSAFQQRIVDIYVTIRYTKTA